MAEQQSGLSEAAGVGSAVSDLFKLKRAAPFAKAVKGGVGLNAHRIPLGQVQRPQKGERQGQDQLHQLDEHRQQQLPPHHVPLPHRQQGGVKHVPGLPVEHEGLEEAQGPEEDHHPVGVGRDEHQSPHEQEDKHRRVGRQAQLLVQQVIHERSSSPRGP